MMHLSFRFTLLAVAGLSAALACAAQSSSSNTQSQSDTSKPAAQSSSQTATPPQKSGDQDKSKDTKSDEKDKDPSVKKKPKKVWTNEEISTVGGNISVVGNSSSANSANSSSKSGRGANSDSAQQKQIEQYRDQLRQLQAQLDATDKKINDLRNFKADNSSASGGIDPRHGYTMTPVADQIKQSEEKKKQIQAKIDAVEDEARKRGIEPGQLR